MIPSGLASATGSAQSKVLDYGAATAAAVKHSNLPSTGTPIAVVKPSGIAPTTGVYSTPVTTVKSVGRTPTGRAPPTTAKSGDTLPTTVRSGDGTPISVASSDGSPTTVTPGSLFPTTTVISGGAVSSTPRSSGVVHTPARTSSVTPTPVISSGVTPTPVRSNVVTPTPVRSSGVKPTPVRSSGIIPTPVRSSGIIPTPVRPGGATSTPVRSSGVIPTPVRPGGIISTPVRSSGIEDDGAFKLKSGAATPTTIKPSGLTSSILKPSGISTTRGRTIGSPATSSYGATESDNTDVQNIFSGMTVAAIMELLARIVEESQLESKYTDNTETQYALMAIIEILNKLDQLELHKQPVQPDGIGKITVSPYARMTIAQILEFLEHLAQTLGTSEISEEPLESRYLDVTVGEIIEKLGKLLGETESVSEKSYTDSSYAHMTFGDILKIVSHKIAKDGEGEVMKESYEKTSVSDMIRQFELLSGLHGVTKTREYVMRIPFTTLSVSSIATKLMQIVDIIRDVGNENSEVRYSTMTLREVVPYLEAIVGIPLTTLTEVDSIELTPDKRGKFMECAYARLSILRMIRIFEQLAAFYYSTAKPKSKELSRFSVADIICESEDKGRSNESTEILWALMNVACIVYKFEECAANINNSELERLVKDKKAVENTDSFKRNKNATEDFQTHRRKREIGHLLRYEDSEDSTAFFTCTTASSGQENQDDESESSSHDSYLESRLKKLRKKYASPSSSSEHVDEEQTESLKASYSERISSDQARDREKKEKNIPNVDQAQPDWSHVQLITKYEELYPQGDDVSPSPKHVVIKDHDERLQQRGSHPGHVPREAHRPRAISRETARPRETPTSREKPMSRETTMSSVPVVSVSGDLDNLPSGMTASTERNILNLSCDLNRSSSCSNRHRIIATMTGLGSRMVVADLTLSVIDATSEEQAEIREIIDSSRPVDNKDSPLWLKGVTDEPSIYNDLSVHPDQKGEALQKIGKRRKYPSLKSIGDKPKTSVPHDTPFFSGQRSRNKGRIEKPHHKSFKKPRRKPVRKPHRKPFEKPHHKPFRAYEKTIPYFHSFEAPSSSSYEEKTASRIPHSQHTSTNVKTRSKTKKSTKKEDNKKRNRFLFVRPAKSSSSGSDQRGDMTLNIHSPCSSTSSLCDRQIPTDILFLHRARSASSSSSEEDLHKRIMYVRPTRSTSSSSGIAEMDDTALLMQQSCSTISNSSGEIDFHGLPYIMECTRDYK